MYLSVLFLWEVIPTYLIVIFFRITFPFSACVAIFSVCVVFYLLIVQKYHIHLYYYFLFFSSTLHARKKLSLKVDRTDTSLIILTDMMLKQKRLLEHCTDQGMYDICSRHSQLKQVFFCKNYTMYMNNIFLVRRCFIIRTKK